MFEILIVPKANKQGSMLVFIQKINKSEMKRLKNIQIP